jgi:hypothetical protein
VAARTLDVLWQTFEKPFLVGADVRACCRNVYGILGARVFEPQQLSQVRNTFEIPRNFPPRQLLRVKDPRSVGLGNTPVRRLNIFLKA